MIQNEEEAETDAEKYFLYRKKEHGPNKVKFYLEQEDEIEDQLFEENYRYLKTEQSHDNEEVEEEDEGEETGDEEAEEEQEEENIGGAKSNKTDKNQTEEVEDSGSSSSNGDYVYSPEVIDLDSDSEVDDDVASASSFDETKMHHEIIIKDELEDIDSEGDDVVELDSEGDDTTIEDDTTVDATSSCETELHQEDNIKDELDDIDSGQDDVVELDSEGDIEDDTTGDATSFCETELSIEARRTSLEDDDVIIVDHESDSSKTEIKVEEEEEEEDLVINDSVRSEALNPILDIKEELVDVGSIKREPDVPLFKEGKTDLNTFETDNCGLGVFQIKKERQDLDATNLNVGNVDSGDRKSCDNIEDNVIVIDGDSDEDEEDLDEDSDSDYVIENDMIEGYRISMREFERHDDGINEEEDEDDVILLSDDDSDYVVEDESKMSDEQDLKINVEMIDVEHGETDNDGVDEDKIVKFINHPLEQYHPKPGSEKKMVSLRKRSRKGSFVAVDIDTMLNQNNTDDEDSDIRSPKFPKMDRLYTVSSIDEDELLSNNQNDENLMYECKLCDKKYSLKAQLNWHIYAHKRNKPFPCILCDKLFVSNKSLRLHVEKMHEPEMTDNNSASSKNDEAQFLLSEKVSEKQYVCKYCSTTFSGKRKLAVHEKMCKAMQSNTNSKFIPKMKIILSDFSVEYSCQICGRRYSMEGFTKHIKKHMCGEIYPCPFCGKEYDRKSRLRKHYYKCHSNVKKFFCKFCNKVFYNKESCLKHIKKLHIHTVNSDENVESILMT